jgi:hypothetical protein
LAIGKEKTPDEKKFDDALLDAINEKDSDDS